MPPRPPKIAPEDSPLLKGFALAFGAFLGLAILKFPNPPVLEHLAVAPSDVWEWLLVSWPVRYAYPLIGLLAVMGIPLLRWPAGVDKRFAALPLLWLGWVGLSCTQTIDGRLSTLTVVHFAVCLFCFYAGLLALGRLRQTGLLFAGLICALLAVIASGWDQHFSGLERSRNYFFTYIHPTQPEVHPDLLKKMQSERIFSTLFYPNSLAGLLLLIVPVALGLIADARARFTSGARAFLFGAVLVGAGGCLVWSGSKAGWLLALGMAVVVLLRLPLQRRWKVLIVSVVLLAGAAGFVVRYAGFFQRGATSVVARFDYWRAAGQNVAAHPLLGTGPGTFGIIYQDLKQPEAEMARLAHNDYLQQASDSGMPAALFFAGTVGWILWATRRAWTERGWGMFGIWLGLAGFAAQSLVEFGFQIPATAWCWFGLAGWLVARSGLGFDNKSSPA